MQRFKTRFPLFPCLGAALHLLAGPVSAHPQPAEEQEPESVNLETVEVEGRAADLLGVADSASQGQVGQPEFKYRPLSRVGELVEVVPGAVATQHSGSGKANQFFLRGFNLDHGTDFNATLDGVPMNLRTHAHGQGYLDLNSIIPELVDKVDYGKGPYYAEQGDFASAGYAQFHTFHRLAEGIAKFTGGEYDYYRGVLANSNHLGRGDLLYAGEVAFFEGPWKQPEESGKYNGMIRYTIDEEDFGLSVNGKAYRSNWIATNQIPKRDVQAGLLDLYGTMDPSDGGKTDRYSLSGNVWSKGDGYKNQLNLYALYYDLDLYSNFTGYLDDPVNGDQLNQHERRVVAGGEGEQTWFNRVLGFDMDNSVGFQVRYDNISNLTLNHTVNRRFLASISVDDVDETSLSFYFKNQTHWLSWFRSIAGLRSDTFFFDVTDKLHPQDSGSQTSSMVSPKLSLVFGPWAETEFFLNFGYGFHSNDARGVTNHYDPLDPTMPVKGAPGLAKQRGAEGGLRTQYIPGLVSTLAVWYLHSDSELVFLGDAGTTEPTGQSERYGVEWTNYYKPNDWLTLDADFAFTSAHYQDVPHSESDIPNSVGQVIGAGVVALLPYDFFATARVRYFGHVPLNETGTAYMGDTTLVNLGAGYQYQKLKFEVDVFNLFDSKANDIAYYYESRYPQNAAAAEGIMIHPVMPRQVRATITLNF
ncbi:Outer membrane receptor proteins, mostly Fe transport [Methylomagnum ishizawai]|uniref:Outer membrane receptor proteins, mostly Fe transport n=1 Tax=Methylomagnum ishizawai TaxID=1760988 RepID=A0A1Y6D4B9_9GAMM|nr:TonB-dependent receptor [Methylomagnum ishizawai]SMF97446.1 Outer membrane receptor proteins, mostly Fe transport [Methylomagnum ishizawai]